MWLQQPESPAGEFAASTSEEAVRLARQRLGDGAPIRCWKTRRGGVLGFFAREAFVAGIQPPAGAITRVGARPAHSPERSRAVPARPPATDCSPPDPPSDPTLSQLVERTRDELTLGSDPVAAAVFSEVLAEAEAAVSGTETRGLPPSAESDLTSPSPERIEGLPDHLARMGVPLEYRPGDGESTLDGLTRMLARLPRSPDLPTVGGSVIVVVGARRDLHMAARPVIDRLCLDNADLLMVDPTDAGRQRVTRRRASNKVTIVTVEASLKSRELTSVASWIRQVDPDFVLAAVPATAKRSDVVHWSGQLDRIDALALLGLANTATPAELMGHLPIAFMDGRQASPLRWSMTLLALTLERGE
jgi:hypothetical protein